MICGFSVILLTMICPNLTDLTNGKIFLKKRNYESKCKKFIRGVCYYSQFKAQKSDNDVQRLVSKQVKKKISD